MPSKLDELISEILQALESWEAMKRDADRCREKLQHIQNQIVMASGADEIQKLMGMSLIMTHTIAQYEAQIAQCPVRIAQLQKKLASIIPVPDDLTTPRHHRC